MDVLASELELFEAATKSSRNQTRVQRLEDSPEEYLIKEAAVRRIIKEVAFEKRKQPQQKDLGWFV